MTKDQKDFWLFVVPLGITLSPLSWALATIFCELDFLQSLFLLGIQFWALLLSMILFKE